MPSASKSERLISGLLSSARPIRKIRAINKKQVNFTTALPITYKTSLSLNQRDNRKSRTIVTVNMKFRIENNRPFEFPSNPKPVFAQNNAGNAQPAVASKIGENNLCGLLQKNNLEKNLAQFFKNQIPPAPLNNETIDSAFPKTASQSSKSVQSAVSTGDNEIVSFIKAASESLKREFFDWLPRTPDPEANENLTMGNPSGAENRVTDPNNYLMEKPQYAESYDRDRGTPNWTSWHLDSASLGSANRQNDFRPDDTLPADWYRVTPADYSDSGYDRGHMTPSGDRTSSREDNSATFLMTNMIPQASKNNQQTWANLENYCRSLVKDGDELYIVSGGAGTKEYIADGKIAVPELTWKVILVQPEGTDDVSRVTPETRVIAVNIPNDNSVDSDWEKYRVSTNSIEQETGYDFFSNVPENIQSIIEAKVDAE